MKIIIQNKITLENPPPKLKERLLEELVIPNPAYLQALEQGYSTFKIPKNIYNFDVLPNGNMRIPRGTRTFLSSLLEELKVEHVVEDLRTVFDYSPKLIGANAILRQYQRKYLYHLLASNFEEGIITGPPGCGKTIFGASIISALGQPTLWLAHREKLLKQTRKKILKVIPTLKETDIGMTFEGKWDTDKLVTIGSVKTMASTIRKLRACKNNFGLVILDEAHHCPAKTFKAIISELNPYYLFGLTATAYRADKLENLMFQALGGIVIQMPLEEVVREKGIIMPTVYYKALDTKPIAGNNYNKVISYLAKNEKRNHIIVSDVLGQMLKNPKNVCLILSATKEHCEILYKLIKVLQPNIGIATGDYSAKHNDLMLEKLEKREISGLVATQELLGEGTDVDIINRVFIALPLRSEVDIEQILGRAQRIAEGKDDCEVIDYVDYKIGMLKDQFYSTKKNKQCRYRAYQRLGVNVKPIEM